jgi:hypothetical protein
MTQLTADQTKAIPILTAITGWGRLQAEAFVRELLYEELHAILICDRRPEVAHVRQQLYNEISDRVIARRPPKSPVGGSEPTDN